jgi:hypothetical protein
LRPASAAALASGTAIRALELKALGEADRPWHRCDRGAEIRRDVASAKVVHFRAFGFKALMLIEAQLGVANTLTQNGAEHGKAKSQVLFSGRQVDIRSRRASRRKGTISLCKNYERPLCDRAAMLLFGTGA